MRLKRMSGALCMLVAAVLFSGCGDQGWVRVSPDGQYVTIVRQPPDAPADSADLELALHHIDRRQTTPIVRFSLDENSPHAGWVYNCQWTPDSRAVCFTWIQAKGSPETETTPSENGDATPAETAQTSNSEHSLMLYEIASGRLTELPISVQAPRWSADGKYLMGLSDDDEPPSIHIYRTDTWVRTQQIRIPREYYDEVVVWDWAHWLRSDPPIAVVHLGGGQSDRTSCVVVLSASGQSLSPAWVATHPANDHWRCASVLGGQVRRCDALGTGGTREVPRGVRATVAGRRAPTTRAHPQRNAQRTPNDELLSFLARRATAGVVRR
jgi:hypothetical protein